MENQKVPIPEVLEVWYGFYDMNLIGPHVRAGKELKRSLREELQVIFDSGEIKEFKTAMNFFLAVEEEIASSIEDKSKRWSPGENLSNWLRDIIKLVCEQEKQMPWFNKETQIQKCEDYNAELDIKNLSSCSETNEKIMKVFRLSAKANELIFIYENLKKKKPLPLKALALQMGHSLPKTAEFVAMVKLFINNIINE